MKRLLLSFMMVLLLAPTALRAQREENVIVIGEVGGNSDYQVPFKNGSKYSWAEMIYPKSLLKKGKIESLKFAVATPTVSGTFSIEVYMGETEQSDYPSNNGQYWVDDELTLVYKNNHELGGEDWEEIILTTPFDYSGDKNLVIATSFTKTSGYGGFSNLKWYYTDTENKQSMCKGSNTASSASRPEQSTTPSIVNQYLPVTMIVYASAEPEEPEVIEGDTWENPISYTSLPIEDTPDFASLRNDYELPGTTYDGADVVYKLTLSEDTKIDATVTGPNAKIAVYTEDFNGEEGPGTDNYYGGTDTSDTPSAGSSFFFDFEDESLDEFTLKDNDGDGENFQINLYGLDGTSISSTSKLMTDNYIYTTQKYSVSAQSEISYTVSGSSNGDHYAVIISTDGINFKNVEEETVIGVTNRTISLSEYAGQDVHIGFRHYNTPGDVCLLIDNFRLTNGSSKSSTASKADNVIEGLALTAGNSYYIVASATGEFTVNVSKAIAEGDIWQKAIDISELPFEDTPVYADLVNNYTLPGETIDGADVVYRLTLEEETTITASVTGSNGKIAVYAEGFNGQESPGADNFYNPNASTEFSYNFNDNSLAEFMLKDADGDERGFYLDGTDDAIDGYSIRSDSYDGASQNYNADNYIFTKNKYRITTQSKVSYKVKAGWTEKYELVISTNGIDFTKVDGETVGGGITSEKIIDLSEHEGKIVHIGFRHNNSGGWWIMFDDFVLSDGTKTRNVKSDNIVENLSLAEGTYYIVASATEAFSVNVNSVEEVVEIIEGDTWGNAIEVSALPFENTPVYADLTNDYTLPGETVDGKDAVYRLTLEEETKINASVTGDNGKIAIYAEGFNGQEYPGADNNIKPLETSFFYDFESIHQPSQLEGYGWRTIDTDDNVWYLEQKNLTYDDVTSTRSIVSHSYSSSPNNYIITTAKYAITENSILSWYAAPTHEEKNKDHYALVVSTDGVEFDIIWEKTPEGNTVPVKETVVFKEVARKYIGKDVYIGFYHYNSVGENVYGIRIDNVRLTGTSDTNTDNSIEGLSLPAGTYYIAASATETFTVNIEKYEAPGDVWQNAITIASMPFENTPIFDDLANNYTLPGETQDGKDVVYKLTLAETTAITASVTGENGKIAVYAEDFDGQDGPGNNNNKTADELVDPEAATTFSYNFDDITLKDNFINLDADGDGNKFDIEDNGIDGYNKSLYSMSWYNVPLNANNFIYTKDKYLITAQSSLSYIIQSEYAESPEYYEVVISTDASADNFKPVYSETLTTTEILNRSVNLSEYNNQEVYIGFRHFNTDGYAIKIDNFALTDDCDSSIESITLPAGTYYIAASATEPFTVNIDKRSFVAKVGEISYYSLIEAVNAAESGAVVTLLKDARSVGFTVNKDVTIDFANFTYTLTDALDISACTVALENGTFTVENPDADIVNIKNGAQLYHENALKGTMTKHVEGTENVYDWGTISSPVGTVNHSQVDGLLVEGAELYLYDEANESWRYYSNTGNSEDVSQPFTTLEAGRGYLYASGNATDVKFTGTFGVDDVEYTLSYASAGQLRGFNMIGNPFTHEIGIDNFSVDNGAELAEGFYVISNEGAWVARTDESIAPMEAVMVKTNTAATFTISNVKNSAKSRGENNGMLQINVSNSQYNDVAYVSFNKGLGLDKISHRNEDIQMVYIPVGDINYAVAIMDKNVTEVPVSFKAMTIGEYTISAKALDCEFAQMTLVDKLTGESTNLLLEDYTFMARSNDNASRFVIYLTGKDNTDVNSEMFVFHNNDELVINNIEGNAVVRIIDIMGRPVAEYNVSGSANISTASFANGVYMVQMSDENGVKVQKVVID